jgi:hypothetical protein
MRYSKGVMWLDDCRIPFVDGKDIPLATTQRDSQELNDKTKELIGLHIWGVGLELDVKRVPYEQNQQGRFTSNLLVCDDMLNDGVITKQSKRTYKPTEHTGSLFGNSPQAHGVGIGDSGSSSRYYDLDKWFDKIIEKL